MEISELVSLFVNNGAMIACLIYFMYVNQKNIKEQNDLLQRLKDVIEELKFVCKENREK